ncbi:universal stress protein [Cupriavidus necator]|uniref:Universal stress protein n=1 Tax=Cupriavidus necator TaxID=106590 RepID=A0A367PQL1_CUPNE|nr:universal stress protein [Cupriavidus necator]QQX85660.1 universal stress protein [Cupriavidus necator]RCJ10192.1 universal stress protein [Cupriavidus necator]
MFRHLLVAVDGSALAEAAFRKALAFAQETQASITAVRACPDFHITAYHTEMLTDTREQFEEAVLEDASKYLDGIAREAAAAGVPCDTSSVVDDHPYDAIIKAAEEKDCDLIVMASHGHRGVKGLLIGSETLKVLTHSKIPVLVYR